jgi:hypothetical protein
MKILYDGGWLPNRSRNIDHVREAYRLNGYCPPYRPEEIPPAVVAFLEEFCDCKFEWLFGTQDRVRMNFCAAEAAENHTGEDPRLEFLHPFNDDYWIVGEFEESIGGEIHLLFLDSTGAMYKLEFGSVYMIARSGAEGIERILQGSTGYIEKLHPMTAPEKPFPGFRGASAIVDESSGHEIPVAHSFAPDIMRVLLGGDWRPNRYRKIDHVREAYRRNGYCPPHRPEEIPPAVVAFLEEFCDCEFEWLFESVYRLRLDFCAAEAAVSHSGRRPILPFPHPFNEDYWIVGRFHEPDDGYIHFIYLDSAGSFYVEEFGGVFLVGRSGAEGIGMFLKSPSTYIEQLQPKESTG